MTNEPTLPAAAGSRKPTARDARVLAAKYEATGFMYTEYPHKSFWSGDFTEAQYRQALIDVYGTPANPPTLLYVHMPYCPQLCWFCTCHVAITQRYDRVQAYMADLHREIDLLAGLFAAHGVRPNIREVHLGGGSPTYLQPTEVDALLARLAAFVDFSQLDEFAIEVDPRRVDARRLHYYADIGIDRLSFGIQDFDPKVQAAVNRPQPAKLIADLLTPDVRARFASINFDVICGLPHQTLETIRRTMETVVELSPDRVCFNYLHYAPHAARHQEMMPKEALPGFQERKALFQEAMDVLGAGGYLRTGYDHFAKPTDAVARAQEAGQMAWNSLGSTPGRCVDLMGIGAHSYGRIGERVYVQNLYDLGEYHDALAAGRLPVYRGRALGDDDVVRRDVIQTLRGYFQVDTKAIGQRHGLDFWRYFAAEVPTLREFADDGMVELSDEAIVITDAGRQYANMVCRIFDAYFTDAKLPDAVPQGLTIAKSETAAS